MNRPVMNQQKVEQCMKRGKSRSQCEKEAYPEKNGGKNGKSKKKAPAKKMPRY